MAKSKCLLVGALDFGTTFSGWAYSFKHDYESEPTKAYVHNWISESSTLITEKTPTCALIAPNGEELVAFGYDAENKYKVLAENGEHRDYYYFRRFKMALNHETLTRDLPIEDEMGKSLPALRVFSLSIKYLTDHLIGICQDKVAGALTKEDFHWVITVPAIWSDAAKQFMRESAKEANLNTEKVKLALEPEAASVFCRYLPTEKRDEKIDIATFPVGTQYLILDAGGGTIDLTVHEIDESGGLKEVHAATGGDWGGTLVDQSFKDLLIEIFGKKIYETFIKTETDDWLDLWRTFEVKKKTVDPEKTDKIIMTLPVTLLDLYKRENEIGLEKALNSSRYASNIEMRKNKMIFCHGVMKELFEKSIASTISCIHDVLRAERVLDVRAILMVGGYSESSMLKAAVKREFQQLTVLNPPQASSAILRGAVIFGHNPLSITHRVLKRTYGLATVKPFIEGVHPESKRKNYEGRVRCKDIFSKIIEKGQSIAVGEIEESHHAWHPVRSGDKAMVLRMYSSNLNNPTYTDEGCSFVGTIRVDLSSLPEDMERKDKLVNYHITFGDTELKATATVQRTGEVFEGTFDFLG